MKVATYVASVLKRYGVPRVFGVPGGENVDLIEALRLEGISFVLAHQETPAAYMAAMTGELSASPGVCIATRGPGAANLVGGVATAFLDRRPLLAITGAHEPAAAAATTHQNLALLDLYRPITKRAVLLTAANAVAETEAACRVALSGQPGPVFVAMPGVEASRDIVDTPTTIEQTRAAPVDLSAVLGRLREARRPLLVGGIGLAARQGTAPSLCRLAERLGAPVLATSQVKGWLPEDHPLFAGTYGMYRDEPLQALIDEADLVLALGLDATDLFKRWRTGTSVVSLAEGGVAEPAIPAEIAIDGDLVAMLDALAEAARSSDWPSERAAAARVAIAEALRPRGPSAPDGRDGRMPPQTVVEELRRALPVDGQLAVDVGSHKIVAVMQWQAYEPNTYLSSNGLSPMGTAVPFAIAAALERPERPTAALLGDGGLLMYSGELETIGRLDLPIVLVVMVDDALSSIKVKQVRKGYPASGVDFSRPAYAHLAAAFHLRHARTTTRAELRAALASAFEASTATLVEAVVDPREYDHTQ
jgi:acetolactate synthase-1/2/3 large subunit